MALAHLALSLSKAQATLRGHMFQALLNPVSEARGGQENNDNLKP